MLKRSRVSNQLDTYRAGQALARPGMDTRNWLLYAQVTAVKMDADNGPLVDVTLLPDGDPETVKLGACYAGPSFGAYFPVDVDDLVIVAFPSGDYDHGGVIVARVWSPAEVPSDLAKNNPDDISIVVKKDTNMRMRVFGSGNLIIACENGKVLLGDETGTQPVARKTDPTDNGTLVFFPGTGGATLSYIPPGTVPTPPTPPTINIPLSGKIQDGSTKVESA